MFSAVTGILTGLVNIGGGWLERKQKIASAKAEKTAELIQSRTDNDHAWEMQAMAERDGWLRRACFSMFAIPFVWAAFDAEAVNDYFTIGLSGVPDWYKKAFLIMIGAIWASVELKRLVMERPRKSGG